MSLLTTKEIMEIIPHRQPMLLIDTIEELEPGKRGVGKKCVSFNEPYFAGHFPNEPVMPGVLTIEALAQVGAVDVYKRQEQALRWWSSIILGYPLLYLPSFLIS